MCMTEQKVLRSVVVELAKESDPEIGLISLRSVAFQEKGGYMEFLTA